MATVMEVGVSAMRACSSNMPLQGGMMSSSSQVSAVSPLKLRNNKFTSSSRVGLLTSRGLKLCSGALAEGLSTTASRGRAAQTTACEASETAVGTTQQEEITSAAVPCRNGKVHTLALASLLAAGFANAKSALAEVSYEDVLESAKESVESIDTDSFDFSVPPFDFSPLTDLFNSDPLAVLLGGGAIVAIPVILSAIFKQPEGYGAVSAKQAFEKLGDEEFGAQLLDIRVEAEGSPDLKVYKKKVTRVPYSGEPDEYVSKVLKKFKDVENSTIYVLDQFDGESLSVAKLLAAGGFKAAYAIRAGAEGPGGWKASELPWVVPRTFNLDLGGIKELISSADTGNVLPATLGAAAAAGVGFVVFSEAETALQLLGSAALVQLFLKKFLFAEDRKKTIQELKAFLDTKVAPKDFVEELKELGGVILPKSEEVQATVSNGAAVVENVATEAAVAVEDATSSVVAETETAAVAAEDATSSVVAETETVAVETASAVEAPETTTPTDETQDPPLTSRPLSPYAQYPGLKPPSSPTPSSP